MSRWFRHYAGMMRDEKLVRVALKSKQPIERVLWVWGAILESAAEVDDNGKYDLDAAEAAYFLRTDEADTCDIIAALTEAGRLADSVVVNWGDRQFSSDRSKERQAAYRERQRREKHRNISGEKEEKNSVTSRSCHGDVTVTAQETETETETEGNHKNGFLLGACEDATFEPPLHPLKFPVAKKGETWQAPLSKIAEWENAFSTIDIEREMKLAHQWIIATPKRRKTAKGMIKFLTDWFIRSTNNPNSCKRDVEPESTFDCDAVIEAQWQAIKARECQAQQ